MRQVGRKRQKCKQVKERKQARAGRHGITCRQTHRQTGRQTEERKARQAYRWKRREAKKGMPTCKSRQGMRQTKAGRVKGMQAKLTRKKR
jgi:hypothetical protein